MGISRLLGDCLILKIHYGVKMTGNLPLFAITDGDQLAHLEVLHLTPMTDLNFVFNILTMDIIPVNAQHILLTLYSLVEC